MMCIIDRITDRTGHKPQTVAGHLVGKSGNLVQLDEGYSMIMAYPGETLVTSQVVDLLDTSRHVTRVQTQNNVYYLRKVK